MSIRTDRTTMRLAMLCALAVGICVTKPAVSSDYDEQVGLVSKSIAESMSARKVSSVAVLDFTDLQGTSTELGRLLAEEISTNLVMAGGSFDVIDRANLNRLLDENKLSRSGLVDPENIKKLGKIAGADVLVTGTYTALGQSIRLQTKVIDTESARIVGAARGDIKLTADLQELMRARLIGGGMTAGSPSGGGTQSAVTKPQTPARPAKLSVSQESFTATVSRAIYDKNSGNVTVFVDLVAKNFASCLMVPKEDAVLGVDEKGITWKLTKVTGMKMGGPVEYQNSFGTKQVSFPGNYIASRESARVGLVLQPAHRDSGFVLDLTVGIWRGPYCDESLRPDSGPRLVSLGFDGIVPEK